MGSNARMMAALMMGGSSLGEPFEMNLTSLPSGITTIGEWNARLGTNFEKVKISGLKVSLYGNLELVTSMSAGNLNVSSLSNGEVLINLTSLNLYSNSLGNTGVETLPFSIGLTDLDLSYNNIGFIDASIIPLSMSSLKMSGNRLSSGVVNAILGRLASGSIYAGILDLAGGSQMGAPFGQGLIDKDTLISKGWTVYTN